MEAVIDLSAIVVGHLTGVHDKLVEVADAVMLLGRFVNAMAPLALLLTFRTVVCNVVPQVFPRKLLQVAYVASYSLQRATLEVLLEFRSQEGSHLARVGTVHRAPSACLGDVLQQF